jgi:hypothetical protein
MLIIVATFRFTHLAQGVFNICTQTKQKLNQERSVNENGVDGELQ